MSYYDDKMNPHATEAARDQANSIYATERHTKIQTVTTAATAVAAGVAAYQARRAAAAAEETALHAEKQADEAQKQTSILEQKAEYERLLSFLDGEPETNRFKVIYNHLKEKITESVQDYFLLKAQKSWKKSTQFGEIKKMVRDLVVCQSEIESIKSIGTRKGDELLEVAIIPGDSLKSATPKRNEHFFASSLFLVVCIAMPIIGVLFLLAAAGGSEEAVGTGLGLIIGSFILWGVRYYAKQKVAVVENLKAEIVMLDRRLAEARQRHKQLGKTIDSMDFSEILAGDGWQVTADECLIPIHETIQEFQVNIPPRCRVDVTKEIAREAVEEMVTHTKEFLKEHVVDLLMLTEKEVR